MSLPPYESHLQTGRITEMIEYTHPDDEDHLLAEQKSNSLKFKSEHRFAFKEKERTVVD